jgi:hypothetical protein
MSVISKNLSNVPQTTFGISRMDHRCSLFFRETCSACGKGSMRAIPNHREERAGKLATYIKIVLSVEKQLSGVELPEEKFHHRQPLQIKSALIPRNLSEAGMNVPDNLYIPGFLASRSFVEEVEEKEVEGVSNGVEKDRVVECSDESSETWDFEWGASSLMLDRRDSSFGSCPLREENGRRICECQIRLCPGGKGEKGEEE